MPDFMAAVQDLAQREADSIVAARAVVAVGRTHCAVADCGEPIAAARTALGAQRCRDCQTEHEARAAHFAHWTRR